MTPTNEMPPALLPSLTAAEAEKKLASAKRKLTDALTPAGRVFNLRLLRDERVLNSGAWALRGLFHLAGTSAAIEGRTVPPMILDHEIVEFWKEISAFEPRLLLGPPPTEKLPEAWRWSFNGQPLPNPFRKETEDLTSQGWLHEHEPVLAKLLEIEAKGGPSYREVADQKAKAEREREARSYNGPNPWDESVTYPTLTARSMAKGSIIAASPELAEMLTAEALAPAIVNPWSKATPNLTRQALMSRDNPFLAHVMKLAAVHENAQRDAEIAEANAMLAKAQFDKHDARVKANRAA